MRVHKTNLCKVSWFEIWYVIRSILIASLLQTTLSSTAYLHWTFQPIMKTNEVFINLKSLNGVCRFSSQAVYSWNKQQENYCKPENKPIDLVNH